jgi:alpha-L-fucosidase
MSQIRPTHGDSSWFTQDRFGMFIHWGLYSLPARHEWVRQREEISDEDYQKYFDHFDPDLYDPKIWAKAAADAGMKYFVITTKHHDGFCLWDTKLTDYKAPNTPYGKDVLRPMVDAFREQGIKVGFYHSLIDWHHPEFIVDSMHSQRNHPDRAKLNESRDQKKYIEYLHGQVRELLTDFGDIDILWFDFSYPKKEDDNRPADWLGKGHEEWGSVELNKMIRELAPNIILNDRLDIPDIWDIKTPEQFQPMEWPTVDGTPVVWEACQTFSGSWGYHREEATWKSPEMLIRMLVDTVSKGGNLLMNVGPTGRGEFDKRALAALSEYGKWMQQHQRAIYGCTQAPEGIEAPIDCRYTYNPEKNRLYLHLFAWPFRHVHLPGLKDKVAYAQLLNDASEIKMPKPAGVHTNVQASMDQGNLTLELPIIQPDSHVPVIELFLK